MGLEIWRAEAPSNIALIKYMGKESESDNRPGNASLSYSLDHLVTAVEILVSESGRDEWRPLKREGFELPTMSEKGQERFLRHFDLLKGELKIPGHYQIRSANNFPSDCGLASSASSFAALTKAAYQLALERSTDRSAVEAISVEELSGLSRRGSGSSCRSFFTPWALWRSERAEAVAIPYLHLHHQVVVLTKSKKQVSSSEAHRRVSSSELFQGRTARAERRLRELLDALNKQDWRQCFELVWSEFWDMHALFETSKPSFGYMTAGSLAALEVVREEWTKQGDGPLATMDAGANVHLLYRDDQGAVARRLAQSLVSLGEVIESPGLYREGQR